MKNAAIVLCGIFVLLFYLLAIGPLLVIFTAVGIDTVI